MSVAIVPEQWDRWIFSSCAHHFNSIADRPHMHIEGFPRETEDKSEWIEFRLDGPVYDRTTNGEWKIDVEINIAICVILGSNAYRIHEIAGVIVRAFKYTIPVNRRGDPLENPLNDDSLLGCLRLKPGDRENVVKSFFGKVRPDTNMMQATVEGHYRMFLST